MADVAPPIPSIHPCLAKSRTDRHLICRTSSSRLSSPRNVFTTSDSYVRQIEHVHAPYWKIASSKETSFGSSQDSEALLLTRVGFDNVFNRMQGIGVHPIDTDDGKDADDDERAWSM